ncbi:hypothetical protein ACTQ46_03045 [Gallicola sp. Sow4_E12]|uniref:hypothetical protein n=1 Tax=Gallicola sp. Sow4_E12 TaxID=3438785 RepID=UPI003F9215BD
MKKIFIVVGIGIVLLAGLLTFLTKKESKISIDSDINIYSGKVVTYEDDHGGFHGDGTTFAVIDFGKENVKDKYKENKEWKPLPLTENLEILNYGKKEGEEWSRMPTIADEKIKPLIPRIKNGYYFFKDRHFESKDPKDDTDLFNRTSMNFIFAVFDEDSNKMYYYKFDS